MSSDDDSFTMDSQPLYESEEPECKSEVISSDKIHSNIVQTIDEMRPILSLSSTNVRLLLNYFKWDKEKLLEKYYDESTDWDKLHKEAGLCVPKQGNYTKKRMRSSECEICCNMSRPSLMTGNEGCGHQFCKSCWIDYLQSMIMDQGSGQKITCPAFSCSSLTEDDKVLDILKGKPEIKRRFQRLIINNFIESNKYMRFCPGPGCDFAIKVEYPGTKPLKCDCGMEFCFLCGHTWHEPLHCDRLKMWLKKSADDSETANYLVANTKDCPGCQSAIEKNGGCNHMTCNRCRKEFCWLCFADWKSHSQGEAGMGCNQFNETLELSRESSRVALERYLFYFNRYLSHEQSLKKESNLTEIIHRARDILQNKHHMTFVECRFLEDAVDTLVRCRRTLMYTFAFAYYLKKTNQSKIFEDNQTDLHLTVEKLSDLLENDASELDQNIDPQDMKKSPKELKQQIQDTQRYCELRRQKLIDHVQDEVWEFD